MSKGSVLGGIPPPNTRLITKEQAIKFLPKAYRGDPSKMDPYFPKNGALCGDEHLKHLLGVCYPILRGYREVLVKQRGPTILTLLGMVAVGDRNPSGHKGPGHIHFRGLPGTGKSLLGEVPRRLVGADFKRISGTVDLLPSDIIGSHILQIDENGKRFFEFVPGPIFGPLVLFDEISRVTPRALSGVLELMSEGTINVAGVSMLANSYVIATSNPDESAGSHQLPDALEDRFMFETIAEPFSAEDFTELLKRTRTFSDSIKEPIASYDDVVKARLFFFESVYVSEEIRELIGKLAYTLNNIDRGGLLLFQRKVLGLSDNEPILRPDRMILSGRSTPQLEGAACALAAMRYRNYVTLDDVYKVLLPVIRHRTHFTPQALSSYEAVEDVLVARFGRSGKTTLAEYLLREIIKVAWETLGSRGDW